jgi:hypothetical protein
MTMKRAIVTGAASLFLLLTADTLVAQQSSSATQVVTFGVARTAQVVASGLAIVASAHTTISSIESRTLQRLSAMPAKVTIAEKNSKKDGAIRAINSRLASPILCSENVQMDLRAFLRGQASSLLGKFPLVLTITN